MRSQINRLTVAALLVCFALVFTSGAWARPVSEPAPTLGQENSMAKNLVDWVLFLIERHIVPHQTTAPAPPRIQPKEGSQMDPNGQH